jgi:F-type H+-transporting ATPase subunit epsilon
MSSSVIKLKIATPDGVALNEDVFSINLKTDMGEITILPHHTPLVTVLAIGEIRIKGTKSDIKLYSGSGVVEVKRGSEVIILSDHISPDKNTI